MNDTPTLTELREMSRQPAMLGMGFVRLVKALALGRGDSMQALAIAESRWPREENLIEVLRSAVTAGVLGSGTWGSQTAAYRIITDQFISALRSVSVSQRLNSRKIPFMSKVQRVSSSSTAAFVGELKPKPVSEMQFESDSMAPLKVAGIVALSSELIRSADPSAELVVKRDLAESIAALVDSRLLDPQYAAVSNVSPASLTNGVTAVTSTGSTALLIAADLESAIDRILTAGGQLLDPIWIAKPAVLAKLAAKMSTTGSPAFPNVKLNGSGTLLGIPIIPSSSAAGSISGGNTIVLVDQSELLWAQDSIEVSVSTEAALQMDSAPSSSASQVTSLWQGDLTGIKVEMYVNWLPRRAAGITAAWIDGLAV
jgi:HK97 family phage major capsid protein